jgi:4-amino-4-deoxy-L-arabinose transferase-like glycosyltransferase
MVLLAVAIAVDLYLSLFLFPATPILLRDDQVYFWMNAQRMLHGERVYQDFFQFTPPGTDLVYFTVFKIFGPHIWVTNAMVLVLGVAVSLVCFRLARQLLERRLALLATFLFSTLIYGRLLNATHHWFSILLIMTAVAIVMEQRSLKRIAIAAALLGLATFFTQTHGIAAGAAFAAFLLWEHTTARRPWRELAVKEAMLILGFGVVLYAAYAHYLAAIGLRGIWYFQFTHVIRYLLASRAPFFGLPEAPSWRRLTVVGPPVAVYVLLAIIYPLILIACWKHKNRDRPMLLAFVGLSLLLEVLLNPNWLRLYAISMPAIILLIWIVGQARSRRYTAGLLWLATAVLAINQIWSAQFRDLTIGKLRGGKVAASPETYEKLRWVNDHTAAEEYFFQAPWPGMYLALELRNPVFLDTASTFEETRPEYIQKAIQQLEARRVRYILWSPSLDGANPLRPRGYQLEPLRSYLHSSYQRALVFPVGEEIWERK